MNAHAEESELRFAAGGVVSREMQDFINESVLGMCSLAGLPVTSVAVDPFAPAETTADRKARQQAASDVLFASPEWRQMTAELGVSIREMKTHRRPSRKLAPLSVRRKKRVR